LFGAFVLYDTQKIIKHAKEFPEEKFDPINQSLFIYLDSINIFVRIVEIMTIQRSKK